MMRKIAIGTLLAALCLLVAGVAPAATIGFVPGDCRIAIVVDPVAEFFRARVGRGVSVVTVAAGVPRIQAATTVAEGEPVVVVVGAGRSYQKFDRAGVVDHLPLRSARETRCIHCAEGTGDRTCREDRESVPVHRDVAVDQGHVEVAVQDGVRGHGQLIVLRSG